VVNFEVVILSFCVLGVAGFDFEELLLPPSPLSTMPVSEISLPLTEVTLPEAMVRLPGKFRPEPPPGKFGRPPPPLRRKPPPPPGDDGDIPDERFVPRAVQLPDDGAVVMVIERAAMVVLDFLDFVPVTVRQSVLLMELTVSLTTFENVVVAVQPTVVCPLVLCTSMDVPLSDATLPTAEPKLEVTAPAAGARTTAAAMAQSATPVVPAAAHRLQRWAGWRLVRVDMVASRSFFTWLLTTQRIDGGQVRSAAGRVDAEDHPDAEGHDDGEHRIGPADADGVADPAREHERQHDAEDRT
jgi:hypothetical protein